jgi:hypothetical protein
MRAMSITSTGIVLRSVLTFMIAGVGLSAGPALASTSYGCPLSAGRVCTAPLTGYRHGDVRATSDGYAFNRNSPRRFGYIKVVGSSKIPMTRFPIRVSVRVKRVHIPSRRVGDYDVVRGTAKGNWKIEIHATNHRSAARAGCHFTGANGRGTAVGGPDLSEISGWTKITCIDTGSAVRLSVAGTVVKSVAVRTGRIPNPGGLLLGAKNTTGGDQFSGYAKFVHISVP